ncbi:MAG: hypothetical protein JSS75_14340 [Bacteroidetes bacterium]|nr:hypothetical protein [Bacteroidota bacterium]
MEYLEFEDRPHPYDDQYYEYFDQFERGELIQLMDLLKELDKLDPTYMHPILSIADLLYEIGNEKEGDAHIAEAYRRVVEIVCVNGKWPDRLIWGWLENRHLLRAIEAYGDMLWRRGTPNEALAVYRQMLQLNPYDNQGVRFKMLAIRMNFTFLEHESHNESDNDSANFWMRQFDTYASEFPNDFQDWLAKYGD